MYCTHDGTTLFTTQVNPILTNIAMYVTHGPWVKNENINYGPNQILSSFIKS